MEQITVIIEDLTQLRELLASDEIYHVQQLPEQFLRFILLVMKDHGFRLLPWRLKKHCRL